ncbi:hypothetical protein, partial [Klebsiella pneumoniae]|uniref:hypothetical protein n=1 Tax=Klebsiella pneumoniae TaxID=573 RepID=UPI0013A58518
LVFLTLLDEVPANFVSEFFAAFAGKVDASCPILVSGLKSLDAVPESIRGQAKLLPDNLKGLAATWNAAVKQSPENALLVSVGPAVRLDGGFC